MENYLLLLCVTLDQENAVRGLFVQKGWIFNKIDIVGENNLQFAIVDNISDDSVIKDTEQIPEMADYGESFAKCEEDINVVSKPVSHAIKGENDITCTDHNQKPIQGCLSEVFENSTGILGEDRIEDGVQLFSLEEDTAKTDKPIHVLHKPELEKETVDTKAYLKKDKKRKYQKKMTVKRKIHCNDCDATYSSVKSFERHKAKNGGHCVFSCEYCGKLIKHRYSQYLLHIRSVHTKERPCVCEICGKGFLYPNKLGIHMRTHTGERPCVCEQCGCAFYTPSALNTHVKHCHTTKCLDNVQCDICGLTMASRRLLMVHKLRTHTEKKYVQCNICNRKFKRNSSLKNHILYKHSDIRNYECNVCGKFYKTPTCLRTHSLIHKEVKSVLCNYCGKGFYNKTEMKVHETKHTGEKPYQCEKCGNRFSRPSALRRHKKLHLEKKE